MKIIIRKTFLVIIAVFCLFSGSNGIGESFPSHFLLTGEFDSPVTFSLYAPEYVQLAQFGKERLDSLNRLLRHFSVTVRSDHRGSGVLLIKGSRRQRKRSDRHRCSQGSRGR